ncbi:MAG: T9SS C-terminal target domain-containing protein, partial [Candidatus Zixiibacteriota bacterium]
DSIVVDTATVNGNGPLKLINGRTAAGELYIPLWPGKFVYREPTGINDNGHTNSLPADYALEQNYPNPFNPSTIIPFSLPHAGEYSLTIYNILGQEVEQFKGVADAPGDYELEWDASNQASGVYFYRLTAGNFVETKKMMLLK